MNLTKKLGLAVIAAIVATAFVGPSSAMAVPEHEEIVLCKEAQLLCEEKNEFPDPTEIHIEVTEFKLLTSLGTVDCETSLAIVSLENELAALVKAHLSEWTLEECSRLKIFGGKEACTVTVNSLGGLSLTPGGTKLLAEAKPIEFEGKNTKATFACGSVINCTYEASAATELMIHSDVKGRLFLLANATPLKATGGGICPEQAKWDATYIAVNLDEGLTAKTGLWIEL